MSDKKKGFLDSLKDKVHDMSYEQVPGSEPVVAAVSTSQSVPSSTVTTSPQPVTPTPSLNKIEDGEVFKMLEKDVMSINSPYSSLLAQADKLKDFIPDATKRIQAAATTTGMNARALLSGIDMHLQSLTQEEQKFELVVDQQVAENVSNKEAELSKLQEDTKTKRDQVMALQKQINANEAKSTGIQSEINSQRTVIADRKAEFATAASTIRAQLEKAKQEITRTLGG